jgi:hypothetical protein
MEERMVVALRRIQQIGQESLSAGFLGLVLLACCSLGGCRQTGNVPLSYDPPGATITTSKPITPQQRRTMGGPAVWFSNQLEGGRLNDLIVENDSV